MIVLKNAIWKRNRKGDYMILIGIILLVLVFCMLSGVAGISKQLEKAIRNQNEIIRRMKNK